MENKITDLSDAPLIASAHEKIVALLAYFNYFKHPLHHNDFKRLASLSEEEIHIAIEFLQEKNICFEHQGYFALNPEVNRWVENRIQAESRALNYWKEVRKNAQRIANFPFVRAVAISGSLSKGVMTEDGDIDYFIITEPKRLWLTRTFLILYKKIRLLNSRKYFCLNYFVDTENLVIPDKNVFTAVEVSHLIPVYDQRQLFDRFFEENRWVRDYLKSPASIAQQAHANQPFYLDETPIQASGFKSALENCFNGKLGNVIEKWAHKKTLKRWMKKFKHFDKTKFELTMRSTQGVSKHHPHDYQNRVLEIYSKTLDAALSKAKSS